MKWNILVMILAILALTCKDSGSEPPPVVLHTLSLTVEDASCTETWLRLSSAGPCSVAVRRDGQKIQDVFLTTVDSVVLDGGLLPKKTYLYQASRVKGGSAVETTQQVQATTMDVTSDNFTWQIDTLGVGNSSILYDVAIINDTLVYAVGELYLRDSTGQIDPTPYNAAYWDGRSWGILRIPVRDFGGAVGPWPLQAVLGFAANDIWFASAADLIQWNGTTFLGKAFFMLSIPFDGQVLKMWGRDNAHIYCVGRSGAIYDYYGTGWQKLSSGTTLDVHDIWGAPNPRTGEVEILAVAGNPYVNLERRILRISGTTVTILSDSGITSALSSVWFRPQREYWVVGDGVYRKNHGLSEQRWRGGPNIVTNYYTNSIRGNGLNDIFLCGAYGDLLHFTGLTWQSHRQTTGLTNGQYNAIAVKGNSVFAVGYQSQQAVVLRGVR